MIAQMTIVLLNYRRPQNIPIILDSISRQTIKPVVFLWDNGSYDLSTLGIDRYEKSSENVGCMVRWKLARDADTPYVMSLDDDLCFARDDALEDVVESLRTMDDPARIVGPTGCNFPSDMNYTRRRDVHAEFASSDGNESAIPTTVDEAVDMVKGRAMALRRDRLEGLEFPDEREDDIYLSAAVAGGKQRFHRVPTRLNRAFRDLPGLGVANWRSPGHLHSRDRAAAKYFGSGLAPSGQEDRHQNIECFGRETGPDFPELKANSQPGIRAPDLVDSDHKPWRPRRIGTVHQRDEKQLLLRMGDGGVKLNPTAALIWECCDGHRTEEEILDELCKVFCTPEAKLRRDLGAAIKGLIDAGALEPQHERNQIPLAKTDNEPIDR